MSTATPTSRPEPKGNFAAIAMRVEQILAISQIRGSFAALRSPGEPPYIARFARPEWTFDRVDENTLIVRGVFRVSGTNGNDAGEKDPNPFVRIEAEFAAVYRLSPGKPFSDDDATAFAHVNATTNVYPYWREFVHSCMTRATLPALLIPPFNPLKGLGVRAYSEEVESVTPSGRDET